RLLAVWLPDSLAYCPRKDLYPMPKFRIIPIREKFGTIMKAMKEKLEVTAVVLDLVGGTPLLDLSNLFHKEKVKVFGKAEWMNPGGSLKDRPVKKMLTEAIKSGDLTVDKTILDSSSGNAGIAYAMIGGALGYKVTIVMPGNASEERKQRIRAHGAEIIETDPLEGYDEALRYAHRLNANNPEKYWLCNQYENDNNWRAHYEGTAAELIEQVPEEITHYVGGVGTGGSLTGIGRRLKEEIPTVTIVSIRPEVWPGIEGLKPLGSPEDIAPNIFDETVVDRWIDITADEARHWCHKLSKVGIFVGQSSGGYVAGVSKVIQHLDEGIIVTLLNDFGDRYFSTGLWR
ncbi:cysteine synthase family protein, partial [Caldithrix abyssi]|nr:cysteine synthase family protein [Caldithrix abyssi]